MSIVLRLNHADIIIPRGAEALARKFYCDFLGFIEIEKPANLQKNGGLWLQISNAQVHLSIQDGFDPSKTKSHLAYEVANLELLKSDLLKRGIAWNENSPVPGFIRGDIRDPFGNRIEFLQAVEG
jgi:catechol 2,3-dioxygenase-like lactoylglutathione lyase family enzyme